MCLLIECRNLPGNCSKSFDFAFAVAPFPTGHCQDWHSESGASYGIKIKDKEAWNLARSYVVARAVLLAMIPFSACSDVLKVLKNLCTKLITKLIWIQVLHAFVRSKGSRFIVSEMSMNGWSGCLHQGTRYRGPIRIQWCPWTGRVVRTTNTSTTSGNIPQCYLDRPAISVDRKNSGWNWKTNLAGLPEPCGCGNWYLKMPA